MTIKLTRVLSLFVAPLSLIAFNAPAFAATDTANMTVTADVAASCTITAGALAFGTYDTLTGAAVQGTALLDVACSVDGVARVVTLGEGTNAEATSAPAVPLRRMASGANMLTYKLYSTSPDTGVWGNTSVTGKSYTALTSAVAQLTVYGTIDAAQDVAVGSYTDTVVATITF